MTFWMTLAILGASCVALLAALPPQFVAVVVGLALLGPLLGSLGGAMQDESLRYPALLTFAVTASGVSFFGIGAAFWGLVAGLGALGVDAAVRRVRGR